MDLDVEAYRVSSTLKKTPLTFFATVREKSYLTRYCLVQGSRTLAKNHLGQTKNFSSQIFRQLSKYHCNLTLQFILKIQFFIKIHFCRIIYSIFSTNIFHIFDTESQ